LTTLAKLLAQKQTLLEELQQDLGPEERDQIERLLEQINAALDSLEPGASD
jgi:DNA-binding MarR family transcriptional regulator